MQDVTIFKLVSLISIWFVGFVGGILPYFIEKSNQRLMSALNCFSAGVFLAGGFLHLLHSAVTNPGLMRWSTMNNGLYEFPYAELFCTCGFLAILCVEQLAHHYQHSQHQHHSDYSLKGEDEDQHDPFLQTNNKKELSTLGLEESIGGAISRKKSHDHFSFTESGTPAAVAFVLFVALSFHSIMEGLGIGAQEKSAWSVFLAIIVHKGLAAFALGAGLLRSDVGKAKFIGYMTLFSLMSIIGIIVGWIISAEGAEDSAASGICLGLASGTFIYVAVMEVIPQEFSSSTPSTGAGTFTKTLYLLVGYAVFGLLAKWS